MARSRNFLFLLLGLAFFCTPLVGAKQTRAGTKAAIRQVLENQAAAWNRGDVVAFMQGYEHSPRTAFVGKTVEYGYDLILARYKSVYVNRAAMGKLGFQNLNVRMLGPDYAAVTGNFHLQRTKQGGGNADGVFSLIFSRSSVGWKIILDHTSAN